jgi:hypothetical protein
MMGRGSRGGFEKQGDGKRDSSNDLKMRKTRLFMIIIIIL